MKHSNVLAQLWVYLLLLCFVPLAYAGDPGKITGKVTDKKTGEALIGVTVLVQGTTTGAVTDVEGRYTLNVSPGTYTLEFKYMGYQTKAISEVEVKAGAPTSMNIILDEPQSKELKEVVVRGSFKQETINALYVAQKNNAVVSDGISADLIKKSPDRNTSDVLKRVSGTSIQDNKFVIVRGLAERYNVTLMNNTTLPSTEPDKKAFSFNIIPSNLIDNIIISKTAAPDLPGDFAGGAIKVNTKDLPDQPFTELSVGVGYNSQTTFKDFVSGQPKGKYDWAGFLDKSRALPAAFKKVKDSYGALGYSDQLPISQTFPNTYGNTKSSSSLPNASLQFSSGNSYSLKNKNRFGYIFSLNYGTSRRLLEGDRYSYNIDKVWEYSLHNVNNEQSRNLGALLNFAYNFGKNKLAFKNFFNNDLNLNYIQRTGKTLLSAGDTLNTNSFSNETTQNGLYNSVLEGQHQLGRRNLLLDWNVSYSRAYRNQPDQRIATMSHRTTDATPEYYFIFPGSSSPAANTQGRIYSNLSENIYGGNINLTVPFKIGTNAQKLKAGFTKNYRSRDFSIVALGYANRYGGVKTVALSKDVTLENIFSPEGLAANEIALGIIPLSSTDYKGTADLNAGYLMLDNLIAEKWRLVWGARIENYQQTLKAPGKAKQQYKNTDVLPSLNLTYRLNEMSNLRASAFMGLNRPEFRELAGFTYYDYENDLNIRGETSLKRSRNTNADLRYEYFTGKGEVLSASVFYKYFDDPIEQTNQGNNYVSYQNAKNATDYGAEIEVRKNLGFIADRTFWNSLTFYVNAAIIKGKVQLQDRSVSSPMQGQSPYLINSGLYYATDNGLSFNLLYNRVGQRLKFRGQDAGVDIYERARDIVDFQISKKLFHDAAEVKLNVSDILAQDGNYYFKYDGSSSTTYKSGIDRIMTRWNPGRNISLSFKYNFSRR